MAKDKSFLHRHNRSYIQRSLDIYSARQSFLIVCEGEKTEPDYFKKFRVPRLIVNVEGLGMNTMSLVAAAIEMKAMHSYDQTWCVFDKDDFPDKVFEDAIQLAERNGINVAYSNQSFELWYVLHFDYMHNAIARDQYMSILDQKLHHKYEKKSMSIYDELLGRQAIAIRNAKNLLKEYNPLMPPRDDPSTTVHLLVEQLLKFSKVFGSNLP